MGRSITMVMEPHFFKTHLFEQTELKIIGISTIFVMVSSLNFLTKWRQKHRMFYYVFLEFYL
jgi:hypothetical protein